MCIATVALIDILMTNLIWEIYKLKTLSNKNLFLLRLHYNQHEMSLFTLRNR